MAECIDLIDLADSSDDSDTGTTPPLTKDKQNHSQTTTNTNSQHETDDDHDHDDVIELISPTTNNSSSSSSFGLSSNSKAPATTSVKASLVATDSSDVLEFGLDDFLGTTPEPSTTSISRFSSAAEDFSTSTISTTAGTLQFKETETKTKISLSCINQRVVASGAREERVKAIIASGEAQQRKRKSPGLSKKEAKEVAARERKRKAYDKKQEKEREKRRKKEVKEGHRIRTGHEIYRKLELCVRLDSNLTGTDTGRAVIAELDKKGFQSKIVAEDYFSETATVTFERKQWRESSFSSTEDQYAVQVDPATNLGVIDQTKTAVVEELLIVFWPCNHFVQKLFESSDDTYTPLMKVLKEPVEAHRRRCSGKKQVVIILEGINDKIALMQQQMSRASAGSSTSRVVCRDSLDCALTWLYVAYGIEVKVTANSDHTAQLIASMTDAVSRKPYEVDPSPYDILAVYKSYSITCSNLREAGKRSGSSGLSDEHFHEMWVNMLRCFPRVSEKMARSLTSVFPTFRSLYDKYMSPNLSLAEKENLIADSYTAGSSRPRAISKSIFYHFTTNDPDRLL